MTPMTSPRPDLAARTTPDAPGAAGGTADQSTDERLAQAGAMTTGQRSGDLAGVAAGAAHDMAHNLLLMDCDLVVLASETLSTAGMEALRSTRVQITYMRGLVRDLQAAAAPGDPVRPDHQTGLAAWWPAVEVLLQAMHRKRAVIIAHITPGLPDVRIKPILVTQIVVNLVGNAVHAIYDRALVEGRMAKLGVAARLGKVRVSAGLSANGRSVELVVADEGIGMSPAVLAMACVPLFTTRAGHGGTGLGLAMVQRMVDGVGGRLELSSVVGTGTTVTVQLPLI